AEVAELKQQLQKKEDMFQRACRYARETELRAERAENLLDSKQGILENAKYNEELEMRISCLTAQLDGERRKSNEDREKDRKRIDELTKQIKGKAQREGVRHLQYSPHLQQLQPEEVQPSLEMEQQESLEKEEAGYVKKPEVALTVTEDPAILQLCQPDTNDSISLDDALGQLRPSYAQVGDKLPMMTIFKRVKCDHCERFVRNIIGHFFSEEHIEKVRASGGRVSQTGVQHWLNELQQAAAAVPGKRMDTIRVQQLQPEEEG
ncbi:hypothetical protein PMAYCL1PPCAC_26495, partial [Pristionchus mayeri]